ncbi:MAG TPA: hypothetical protein VG456_06300 [Candidatus Sulfopaludibacter sp.]|jgi:hypothetical protein|nr:hypothetical protein [Candidatus Sulfopaludibacter sp.]
MTKRLLLVILFAAAVGLADDGASVAFGRYLSGLNSADPWSLETVEIDAALPRLAEKGKLRAIRRMLPHCKPEYEMVEMTGDGTVKRQLLVRYLSEEVRTAAIPPTSVAVTPANYKFSYKGPVQHGDGLVYAFLITPRKKREGLIKGELWLDESGVAVHESGYLVKNPSIFVKRMYVTRELVAPSGLNPVRVTNLALDVRGIGRAELNVQERPCSNTCTVISSDRE